MNMIIFAEKKKKFIGEYGQSNSPYDKNNQNILASGKFRDIMSNSQ